MENVYSRTGIWQETLKNVENEKMQTIGPGIC